MQTFGRILHPFMLTFVMIVLFSSLIQKQVQVPEARLAGVSPPDEEVLSLDNWFSGSFQLAFANSMNYHAGFHASLVRLNNQLTFTLFRISPVPDIIVGKERYLYAPFYVDAYTGRDYTGEKTIASTVEKLLRINNFLKSQAISFIVVFVPNKARLFSEFLPDHVEANCGASNYLEYRRLLLMYPDISFIDLNSYFMMIRDSSEYPLFPKFGIHWTNIACQTLVPDTLVKFIVQERHGTFYPASPEAIVYPDSLRIPDSDLYELMNLFSAQSGEPIPYPVFSHDADTSRYPYRVLTIGDSFFWNIYANEPWENMFRENDYWFYGEKRYPESKYKDLPEDSTRLIREDLLAHEVVIVMISENNLVAFMHFPERAIKWLGLENMDDIHAGNLFNDRLNFYISLIRKDPKWLAMVTKKAGEWGISVDEMIRRDAAYMVETEKLK